MSARLPPPALKIQNLFLFPATLLYPYCSNSLNVQQVSWPAEGVTVKGVLMMTFDVVISLTAVPEKEIANWEIFEVRLSPGCTRKAASKDPGVRSISNMCPGGGVNGLVVGSGVTAVQAGGVRTRKMGIFPSYDTEHAFLSCIGKSHFTHQSISPSINPSIRKCISNTGLSHWIVNYFDSLHQSH